MNIPTSIHPFQADQRPLLCPTQVLLRMAEDKLRLRRIAQKQKALLTAELLCRLWMKENQSLKAAVISLLSENQCHDFCQAARRYWENNHKSAAERIEKQYLFDATSEFSGEVHKLTIRWLRGLLRADGLIPVVTRSDAFAIPFELHPRLPGEPYVVDSQSAVVPVWNKAIEEMAADIHDAQQYQVILQVAFNDDIGAEGNSLQLPVCMAIWRKTDPDIPCYHPLRLITTGALEKGILQSVSGCSKKYEMSRRDFRVAIFCAPQDGMPPEARDETLEPLHAGLADTSGMKTYFRNLIIQKNLAEFAPAWVMQQIPAAKTEIRDGLVLNWSKMKEMLETYRKYVNRHLDPMLFLELNMLYAVVLCHCGETQEASEINQHSGRLARSLDCRYKAIRLQIERMVIEQDLGEYEEAARLGDALLAELQQENDPDLWMRFYGTRGQLHCHACIAGRSGFSPDQGRSDLLQALDFAKILNKPDEIARDMIYLCLWNALFQPDQAETEESFADTRNYITSFLSGDQRQTDLNYLDLYRGLGIYREYLQGKPYRNDLDDLPRLPLPPAASPWQRALSDKYFASIAAAAGKNDLARQVFNQADDMLKHSKSRLFQFFRVGILAQAFCSLINSPDKSAAHDFRKRAMDVLQSTDFQPLQSAQTWKIFLENPDGNFPGLQYFY